MPEKIMNLLVETSSFRNISVLATPMPISLKEAYYDIVMEYLQNKQVTAIIFLKERLFLTF